MPNLENAKWHSVGVTWNVSSHTLSYTIDGKKAGSLSGDLASLYFGGSDYAYFGFTAATGAGKVSNLQQVQVTQVSATYAPVDAPLKSATFQLAGKIHTSGNAGYDAHSDVIILTPPGGQMTGAVMSETKFSLASNIDVTFDFYLGAKDGGSEGAAFVMHSDSKGAGAFGAGGAGLGAFGIENGLAIQIDAKKGSDTTSFFDTDAGTAIRPLTNPIALGNLENGNWHQAHVTWDAPSQTLQYWIDGKLGGTLSGDLAGRYFGGSELVNFGFTGATGSAGNSQQVQITHLDAVTGAGTHSQYGLLSSIGDRPFVDQTASHLVTASGSAVFDTHTGITTLTSASKSQAGAVFSDGFIDLKGDFNLGFSFMAGTKD